MSSLGVRLSAMGDGVLLKSFKWGSGHSSMEKNWRKTKHGTQNCSLN